MTNKEPQKVCCEECEDHPNKILPCSGKCPCHSHPAKEERKTWKVGEKCLVNGSCFDEQLPSFNALVQSISGINTITAVMTPKEKGSTGQWVRTDKHNDWLDRAWCTPVKEETPEWEKELNSVFDSLFDWADQIKVSETLRWKTMYGFKPSDLKSFISSTIQKAVEERDKELSEYIEHTRDCIRSQFEAGEPTTDGGYREKIAGKWYESRPIDKTPKCNCGLSDLLSHLNTKKE